MHSFHDLEITTLKKICSKYNLHVKIAKYSKLSKTELIPHMEKHLMITQDGKIKMKKECVDSVEDELSKIINDLKNKVKEVKEKVQKQKAMPKEEEKNINIEKKVDVKPKKVMKALTVKQVKEEAKKCDLQVTKKINGKVKSKTKKELLDEISKCKEKAMMKEDNYMKEERKRKEDIKKNEMKKYYTDQINEEKQQIKRDLDDLKVLQDKKKKTDKQKIKIQQLNDFIEIGNNKIKELQKKMMEKEEEQNINVEKEKKTVEEMKEEEKQKEAPYNFYDDFDKTIRKYISLDHSLNEEHFNDRIKEYENELKYLQNRKLKSAKSKEENDNKITNSKIYLNSYKEKLNNIPQNKKAMENLLTSFEEKYKIKFKEFLNQLKETGEDIDGIRNKPYWSVYDDGSRQKIINKIYSNLNKNTKEEKPKKETPKEEEPMMKEKKPMSKIDKIENELQKLEQLIKMDEKENEKEHKEMKKEIKQKKDFSVMPLTGSKAEMTKQYKKQALKFHPDKNIGHEEEAKKAFQELTNMYQKLMGDDAKEVVDEEEDKFNSKSSFVNIKIMSFIKRYDTVEKRKENLQASIDYIKKSNKYTPEDKKNLLKRMEMFNKDADYLKFIGSQSSKKLSMDDLNKALNEWYQLKFIGNSKRDVKEWCEKYKVCENKSYDEIKKTFKL